MWDFENLARGSACTSTQGKLLLARKSLAAQTEVLGVTAELHSRHRTPHSPAKHADTFPALCFFFFSVSGCGMLCKCWVLQCPFVCCLFLRKTGRLTFTSDPLCPTPKVCFTFSDMFERRCQIIIGKRGGGMFFLPSWLQTRQSCRAAAEGSRQCIHTGARTGALSAPASVCSALAEDNAVSAEATTSI